MVFFHGNFFWFPNNLSPFCNMPMRRGKTSEAFTCFSLAQPSHKLIIGLSYKREENWHFNESQVVLKRETNSWGLPGPKPSLPGPLSLLHYTGLWVWMSQLRRKTHWGSSGSLSGAFLLWGSAGSFASTAGSSWRGSRPGNGSQGLRLSSKASASRWPGSPQTASGPRAAPLSRISWRAWSWFARRTEGRWRRGCCRSSEEQDPVGPGSRNRRPDHPESFSRSPSWAVRRKWRDVEPKWPNGSRKSEVGFWWHRNFSSNEFSSKWRKSEMTFETF